MSVLKHEPSSSFLLLMSHVEVQHDLHLKLGDSLETVIGIHIGGGGVR